MLRRRARGPSLELLAIASFLLVGSAADAGQVYALSGKFVSNLGLRVEFPLFGDTACPSIVIDTGPPGTAGSTPPFMTNPGGCIPAKGKVTTTGKGVGGAFAMPPNALVQPAQSSNGLPKHWLPVKNAAPVRQISTSNAFAGPAVARTNAPGSMADGMNTAAFRAFRAGAWNTQTGRVAAQFTWCKGGCTGGWQAVIKYLPKPNQFGGTMGLLISAGPNGSKLVLQPGAGIIFQPLGAYGSRPTGAGYAVKHTDPPVTGSIFAKYITAMTTSMRITMGTTYVGPFPGQTRMQYGFPFTTGTVVARYSQGSHTTTLTAKGGDAVTPMGARNISLVAGGVTVDNESLLLTGGVNMSQMVLPEPGAAGLLAGIAALLWIAASRATRSER